MELSKIKGWGKAKVAELEAKGITCVEELLVIPPPQYAEMIEVDNETANAHFQLARDAYNKERNIKSYFKKGSEYKIEDNKIEKTSTGTKALDKLFMGGIECGATTEIYAEFGCGKTQFCHTMCVRVQLPKDLICPNCNKIYEESNKYYCDDCEIAVKYNKGFVLEEIYLYNRGGLDAKAIWINTEGTFEPSRIKSISESLGLDSNEVLDNISVADAFNSVDQYKILLEVEKLLVKDDSYKLIVVDSATGLFRQDFSGRGMLSERQKYLDNFLTLCNNMAKFHKIAVIWTNQVYTSPMVFYGDPTVAVGGTIIAHKSTYRVYFMKSGKFRIAKMIDSPKDRQTEVMFGLSQSGVVDMDVAVEEEKQRKKEITAAKTEAKKGNID